MALRLGLEEIGPDVLLIRPYGAIDLASISEWEDLVHRVIQQRRSAVIVDVGLAGYISARGLEMLLALAANQSLLNGCLAVAGAHGGIRRAAKLVGLWDMAMEAGSVHGALQKIEDFRAGGSQQEEIGNEPRRMMQGVG